MKLNMVVFCDLAFFPQDCLFKQMFLIDKKRFEKCVE